MHIATEAKTRDASGAGFPPGIKYLMSVNETALATNRSRSSVYLMIAAGELQAVKDGARTLVYGESILRRTANLPRADMGKPKAA